MSCALEAARAVGAKVVVPPFGDIERDKKSSDFNDLARIEDDAAVAQAFVTPLDPDALLCKLVVEDPPRALTKWIFKARLRSSRSATLSPSSVVRSDYRKAKGRVGALDGLPDTEEEDEKETARQVTNLSASLGTKPASSIHQRSPLCRHHAQRCTRNPPDPRSRFPSVVRVRISSADAHRCNKGRDLECCWRAGRLRPIRGRGARHLCSHRRCMAAKFILTSATQTWRAIEIDAEGWRIVSEPPVRFRRSDGMRPLPEPTRDGSARDLRHF